MGELDNTSVSSLQLSTPYQKALTEGSRLANEKLERAKTQFGDAIIQAGDKVNGLEVKVTKEDAPGQMTQWCLSYTLSDGRILSLWIRFGKPTVQIQSVNIEGEERFNPEVGEVGCRVSYSRMSGINDGCSLKELSTSITSTPERLQLANPLHTALALASNAAVGSEKLMADRPVAEAITASLKSLTWPKPLSLGNNDSSRILDKDSDFVLGPEHVGNLSSGRLKEIADAFKLWKTQHPQATAKDITNYLHDEILQFRNPGATLLFN